MNTDTFDELWSAQGFDRTEQRDFWNQRAASFDEHSGGADSCENRRLIVDRLVAKARLDTRGQVLDIGCGPGRHAILFARQVAQVEAFDLSPNMIELARRNAHEAGQENVAFQVMDWANADLRSLGWEKRFDLVLASKTPAVNDLAALKKMIAASRGFCCFISKADTKNSIRDQLQPLLDWKDTDGRSPSIRKDASGLFPSRPGGSAGAQPPVVAFDEKTVRGSNGFYCAFNLLWLMGCYPEVSYYDRAWELDSPLEEAVPMYIHYFERYAPLAPEHKNALAEKLENLSQDGRIHEQIESKVAVLFWSVNTRR